LGHKAMDFSKCSLVRMGNPLRSNCRFYLPAHWPMDRHELTNRSRTTTLRHVPAVAMKPFDPTSDADVEQLITDYRAAVQSLESATDELACDEWQRIIAGMRATWSEWQGEDSLHAMAFGELD
jgi:hypothetical protein